MYASSVPALSRRACVASQEKKGGCPSPPNSKGPLTHQSLRDDGGSLALSLLSWREATICEGAPQNKRRSPSAAKQNCDCRWVFVDEELEGRKKRKSVRAVVRWLDSCWVWKPNEAGAGIIKLDSYDVCGGIGTSLDLFMIVSTTVRVRLMPQ